MFVHPAPAIANLWRTGPDHIPLWWMKNGTQDAGNSGGTSNIIQQMAGLSQFTRRGVESCSDLIVLFSLSFCSPYHFNDPDYIEIEPLDSDREVKTQISFWALFAAPFVVASDIRKDHVSRFLRNKEVIAVNQDPLVRAGDLRLGRGQVAQVWSRPLSGGGRWAVIAYNSNVWDWQSSVSIAVHLDASVLVGITAANGTSFSIRNLWTQETVASSASKSYSVGRLGPKESVLLLVTQND